MNALICSRWCRSFLLTSFLNLYQKYLLLWRGLAYMYGENFHLLFGECTMVLKVPLFIPLAPCVFLRLCSLPRLSWRHVFVLDDSDLSLLSMQWWSTTALHGVRWMLQIPTLALANDVPFGYGTCNHSTIPLTRNLVLSIRSTIH